MLGFWSLQLGLELNSSMEVKAAETEQSSMRDSKSEISLCNL